MAKAIPITVTLPDDLVKSVDEMAKKEKVSRSTLVTDALRRRMWLWRLTELQKKARGYAARLRVKSEKDVERLLHP